ncbi:uncharacterized protein VP01_8481g1, partial [Puccinia sorghi]
KIQRLSTNLPFPAPFPSPFINESSYFYSQFPIKKLSKPFLPHLLPSTVNPKATTHIDSSFKSAGKSAKTKFLCEPIKYKSSVKFLLASGSNFNKWKADLNMDICLYLKYMGFLENLVGIVTAPKEGFFLSFSISFFSFLLHLRPSTQAPFPRCISSCPHQKYNLT